MFPRPPNRSAVEDGASHVIVLRTRPDPCAVLGKGPGVFEKLIAKRFIVILSPLIILSSAQLIRFLEKLTA